MLETFAGPDGRFAKFPMQRKKFEAILRHVARALEPGVDYHEKQLNTLLRRFSDDVATLRRGLVDHRFVERDPGGARYTLRPGASGVTP